MSKKSTVNVTSGLSSFAGTCATYTGNERMRMRRLDSKAVRVHVARGAFRERTSYVAFEIDAAELRAMIRKECGVQE